MKMYASMETNGQGGWGDSFPVLFFAEWLKQNDEADALEIWMWDQGAQGTGGEPGFNHRDHIVKPDYIKGWLDGPPVIKDNFDTVLSTHHSHPQQAAPIMSDQWDPHYDGWLPPAIYKDSKVGVLRLHNDAWWATLVDMMGWRPTMPELLNVPTCPDKPFIAIQLRRDEPNYNHKPGRNALEGDNFDRWARNYIHKFDDPVMLLSDQVETDHPNIIDASKCSLWEKIYFASKAEEFHGAHSGFGAVCASYAKKSFVINMAIKGAHRNPSLVVFDNVRCKGQEAKVYEFNGPYVRYEGTLEVQAC